MKMLISLLVLSLCLIGTYAQMKVGVGKVNITPETAIWMSGYAFRNKPSEGVLQDIWAKTLVIEDNTGNRIIIVTADIIGLSGEVVVDYSLTAKKMYPSENLFVAGYCTEVPCYIPSKRIIQEGGYEPETSMIYYGLPGPFADNVEDKLLTAVKLIMKEAGAKQK